MKPKGLILPQISLSRKLWTSIVFAIVITLSSVVTTGVYMAIGKTQSAKAASGLSITSISPTGGSQAGGTHVAIDGSGFMKTVDFVEVSSGYSSSCAIATDGWAYCWGNNNSGQLGNGSTAISSVPVAILHGDMPTNSTVVSIEVGGEVVCIVASDNKAYCWGNNEYGQLGNGSMINSSSPVLVASGEIPAGVSILKIVSSAYSTCILGSDSQGYCWGLDISTTPKLLISRGDIPVGVEAIDIVKLSDAYSVCILASDGWVYCSQALGVGLSFAALPRGDVSAGETLTALSGKDSGHACVVSSNNNVYCWGLNHGGQLGNGGMIASGNTTPVRVLAGEIPPGAIVTKVSAGINGSCIVTTVGEAYCWGAHANSINSTTPVALPRGEIPSGTKIDSITIGTQGSCLVAANNTAYCWGYGYSGRLGNGSDQDSAVPVLVTSSVADIQSVTFDGIDATDFGVWSDTQMSAYTPAHAFGPVPIVVTDKDGRSATYSSYTYKDAVPPVITFVNDMEWYHRTLQKGESFDPRAQIKSVVDDVEGNMDIANVQITSTYTRMFDSSKYGDYSIEYIVTDAAGNVGVRYGTVSIPGVNYNTTITNNTLPTFNGSGGGYSTYSLAVYIVHAGTVFDPANPGSVKPRYLVRADPLDAWTVVTDQTAARTATVKEGEIQFVYSMIEEYSLNSYVATGAQLTRSATPSQVIDAGCTSSLFASSIGYPEESECRIELQSWLEREMSNQLSHFDTNAENYDWAPLGDGIYDIYFYDSWTPFSASFPGGLIVDTTKPQVTIAVPANTTANKVSPALTGTVGRPTDTVIVTINGKSYTAKNNGDGTWVLAAGVVDSLASGIYEVVVRATNQAGTVTVTTTTLTIAPRNDLAATGMSVLMIAGIGGGLGVLGGVIYVVRRKISKQERL